jgi:hypothetical protein
MNIFFMGLVLSLCFLLLGLINEIHKTETYWGPAHGSGVPPAPPPPPPPPAAGFASGAGVAADPAASPPPSGAFMSVAGGGVVAGFFLEQPATDAETTNAIKSSFFIGTSLLV